MVPPPKGKDLSRMSAPLAVSTTSASSQMPLGSPVAGTAATMAATSSAASSSPGGGGNAPSPSPRTGKPKGKDFSRMAGPPPSSSTTPEAAPQLPPTESVAQPPTHIQNYNINTRAAPPISSNDIVGMVSTNPAIGSTTYAQTPQYQPLMPSAPVNFIQQQHQQQQQQQQMLQQQQQQMLQQQQQQMMQQQQQQMMQQQMMQQQPAVPSSLNMLLNPVAVAPLLPTQRPSWSEARLSTMPHDRGQVSISRSLSVMESTGNTTATATGSITDTNDGYGKPSLAPILGEKLQNLCHSIDPSYSLDSEVQERLVEMADAFIEKVTKDSIKLAKHRGSSYMDVVDVALALKKGYNLEVPGLGRPSVATTDGLGGGGTGGRGTGTVMGGWMFADMVGPRGKAGEEEGGQEPLPKKKKRGSTTVVATNAM